MLGLNRFLVQEVELPLVPVLADLEETGYLINGDHFANLTSRLGKEREQLLANIRNEAGRPDFNPASSPQVRTLLFETLELPVIKKTDTGQPSTAEEALQVLRDKHPVVPLLSRYRELNKILTTYCTIPNKADPDGRLRFEFRQLGAETGRISSPSIIQTLPKGEEFGIRKGFVAAPGFQIVAADFNQQELRVLAAVSGDRNLLAAITQGVDLHGLAAVKVFGLDCGPNKVKELHKDLRNQIKAIQFGIIYGRGSNSLAAELGITQEEAQKLLEDYFAQFPAVAKLIDTVHAKVQENGYIDDLFGRRRYLPDAKLNRPAKRYDRMAAEERSVVSKRNRAKRAAQNFVIQGASATITKLAMVRCHQHIRPEHPKIHMLLTLHDELQFEVPEGEVDHFAAELPALMCDLGLERFDFPVRMAVEVKVGPSWGDLGPYQPKEGKANEAASPSS